MSPRPASNVMKYIFDFDDVLFNNTEQFKKHMFNTIADAGIPDSESKAYYLEVHEKEFSLKKFILELLFRHNKNIDNVEKIYSKILSECKNFINIDLINLVKKAGKENCFIVTNGDEEFQHDKIRNSGVVPFFNEIIIVPNSKKEVIYDICTKYNDEKVIFYDDKAKFFYDIDKTKCPNLEMKLYKI